MGWTYYLLKVGMFATVVSLIYFAVNLVIGKVGEILNLIGLGSNILYILHAFKICEAVNTFLSFWIGGYIMNKIINYWL